MTTFDWSRVTIILAKTASRKRWHIITSGALSTVSDVQTSTYTLPVQSPENPDGTMQVYFAKQADFDKVAIPLNTSWGWSGVTTITFEGSQYVRIPVQPESGAGLRVINSAGEWVHDQIPFEDASQVYIYLLKDNASHGLSGTKQWEGFLKVSYFELQLPSGGKMVIEGNSLSTHGFLDLQLQNKSGDIYGNIFPAFLG